MAGTDGRSGAAGFTTANGILGIIAGGSMIIRVARKEAKAEDEAQAEEKAKEEARVRDKRKTKRKTKRTKK